MMNAQQYPTYQEYRTAVQNPNNCFLDSELQGGKVLRDEKRLPRPFSGGFTVTWNVTCNNNIYAVRCFQKKSDNLKERYQLIEDCLRSLNSHYFLEFDFQDEGISVNGPLYPIVKMDWGSGETLGEFLTKNYSSKDALDRLNDSLRDLALYLEVQGIAHGDICPENILVDNCGSQIQLVDYDGMYVNGLSALGSTERGKANFQHPDREKKSPWDERLDRFSFISLSFALQVLSEDHRLWGETQSSNEKVLFSGNDFEDPIRSDIFQKLTSLPQFRRQTENLASICRSAYSDVPTLKDFLEGSGHVIVPDVLREPRSTASYVSSYIVLDATDYDQCEKFVGDRVELVGKVESIKKGTTFMGTGSPYIFVNFGDWTKKNVKIIIWSSTLSTLEDPPDESLVGKFVSVIGFMEEPFHSTSEYGYTHLAVKLELSSVIHEITPEEAEFRLSSTDIQSLPQLDPSPPDSYDQPPRRPHPPKPEKDSGHFVGQTVYDTKHGYGQGQITRIVGEGDSAQIIIRFDRLGKRTLTAAYANLQVVDHPSPPDPPDPKPGSPNARILEDMKKNYSSGTRTSANVPPTSPQSGTQPPANVPSTSPQSGTRTSANVSPTLPQSGTRTSTSVSSTPPQSGTQPPASVSPTPLLETSKGILAGCTIILLVFLLYYYGC